MLTNINKSNPQNHIKIYGNVIKTDILQITVTMVGNLWLTCILSNKSYYVLDS